MNTQMQSIYIPRMCKTTTEDKICHIMYNYFIGNVSHVDFTCVNKKPGFIEDNSDEKFKSAFIHFKNPHLYPAHLREEYIMFWDKIERGETCKLFVGENPAISTNTHEYWLCLKNKNPVPRTQMNIHQVAEAGRHLEKIVEQQEQKIEQQEQKIRQLEEIVSRLDKYNELDKYFYHTYSGDSIKWPTQLIRPTEQC